MAPITQDILSTIRQRRAAGERIIALAGELGIPWQRLEKLTRLARRPLPQNRTQLRRELRWARLMLSTVPSLGRDKPWATAWRDRICRRLRCRIAELTRQQAKLSSEAQVSEPVPRLWKPRPATAADARIARLYNPKATPGLWGEV
jgi:hypothetical protein